MARTQVKAQNILDHSLTGASFRSELRYYVETVNYSQGARVTWAGREYTANTSITGGTEGDLSNAPNVSTNWDLYTGELGQLAKIEENGNTGFRLRDANPANYGDIGAYPVDFSLSGVASTTNGATGDASFCHGLQTKAGADYQAVFGRYNNNHTDTVFEIGAGISDSIRWNVLDVYLDGTVTLSHATPAEIDTRGDQAVVHKKWVEENYSKELKTANFDSTANQTDFTVSNKVFSNCLVHINGVLQRDNSYTVSDDGTDTTITLDTALKAGIWVSITTL
jgi:hypothetical protein